MTGLPRSLARGVLLDTAVALGVLCSLAAAFSMADTGVARPMGLLITLLPPALGAATGARLGRARSAGEVDGWMALGGGPRQLVGPLLALAGGLGVLCLAPLPSASVPLPPPVEPGMAAWWAEGWTSPPRLRWTVAPGDLAPWTLLSRWWEGAPAGARAGVDGAEVVRRLAVCLACPVAVVAGAAIPLGRGSRRSAGVARAALAGAGGAAAWLLLGTLAVGACYSMT